MAAPDEQGQGMKISFSGVWDDTARMLRTNASLFVAVAGVFLFLPSVIISYVAPQPTGGPQGVTPAMLIAYAAAHWELILAVNLVGFIGNLALLLLALDQDRPTVGRAIASSFRLLPAYFLATLLFVLIAALGFAAFIIPGLYLAARMSLMGPVIVAENRRNPIAVLKRSFALTKKNGWAILALIAIMFITFWIVSVAVTVVFGSIFLLLDGGAGSGGVGSLLLILLGAAISAAFNTMLMVLLASLYRRLSAEPSSSGI